MGDECAVLLHRNEQYYDAIMSIWNQLYINIKSLISWQYCVKDINYINSLTLSMVRYPGAHSYALQWCWLHPFLTSPCRLAAV